MGDSTPGAAGNPRNRNETRLLITAAVLGIIGAAAGVLADLGSGYAVPEVNHMGSAYSLTLADVAPLLEMKERWQLLAGHYLAVFGIPLGIFGVYFVSRTLLQAGKITARIFLLSGCYAYAVGASYHGVFGPTALIVQSGDSNLIRSIGAFFDPFGLALVLIMLALLIYLFVLMLMGRSSYPRSMAFVSPLCLQIYLSVMALVVPNQAATILRITGFNLSMLVFFVISLGYFARRMDLLSPEQGAP